MPEYVKCQPCGGGGKVMGGGMVYKNCEECHGKGQMLIEDNEIDYLAMKQTEGYKSAKKRLMNKNTKISEKQAEDMLDEELAKEIK